MLLGHILTGLFLIFDNIKKSIFGQRKNIFGQHKKYGLLLEIIFH